MAGFISFLIIPVYTYFLSPADYGVLSIANMIFALLLLVFTLGIDGALIRFYFDFKNDAKEYRKFLGTNIVLILLLGFLGVLLMEIFGQAIVSLVFKNIPYHPYIRLVVWYTFFNAIFVFLSCLLRAKEKSFQYILLVAANLLFQVILVLFFLVFLRRGIIGVLEAYVYSAGISAILYLAIIMREAKLSFDLKKAKSSLLFGLPLMPYLLAVWVIPYATRIFLERYASLKELGLFSLGFNLSQAMVVIVGAFNCAWAPFYYSLAEKKEGLRILARVSTYFFGLILLTGLVFSYFAKEVIIIVASPNFYDAHRPLFLLIGSTIFYGLYYIVVQGIYYVKKTYFLSIAAIIAAIVNIAANFLLVPKFGMMGAAMVNLISYFILFIFVFIFSQKLFPLPYEYSRIFKIFFAVLLFYFLSHFVSTPYLFLNIIIKIILIGCFFLTIFLLKIFRLEEIEKIKSLIKFHKK